MSSIRNPVGPQPSGVYWRRRLLLVAGLVAVIIVIVLLVVGPGSGDDDAANTGPSNSTNSPDPEATLDENAEPVACSPGSVAVTAVTDKGSYAAGEQPMLSLSLTNTGTVPCLFNAGSDVQLYSITSGEDPIWNSTDCQTAPVATEATLEPGVALATAPFAWDRTRSDPSTCTTARTEVIAGGATYRLAVTVDGVEAASDVPFILN